MGNYFLHAIEIDNFQNNVTLLSFNSIGIDAIDFINSGKIRVGAYL